MQFKLSKLSNFIHIYLIKLKFSNSILTQSTFRHTQIKPMDQNCF